MDGPCSWAEGRQSNVAAKNRRKNFLHKIKSRETSEQNTSTGVTTCHEAGFTWQLGLLRATSGCAVGG